MPDCSAGFKEDHMLKLLLYGTATICLLVLSHALSKAEWKPEYAQAPQHVRDWYKAQELNPEAKVRLGVSWKSCCEHSDVVKTRFRVDRSTADDQWFYLDGNTWRQVPADIIHWNDPTPDGQPVLFVYSGMPTCFYPGDTGG